MSTRIIRVLVVAAVVVLASPGAPAGEPEAVFVERFEGDGEGRWKMESTLDPAGLRWYRKGEEPGLHFKAVARERYIRTHDYAWAQWNVGAQPFELSWDLHLERGFSQRWFYPGVAVAMTSAPPGQMGPDDVAVSIGVHMSGIAGSVRKGGFYNLHTEGRGAWSNFRDRDLSHLIDKATGGTASMPWPMKQPTGRLAMTIRREKDNTVHFTVRWPDLPGGRGEPFWTGKWQMPENVAKVPLRYVCVKRVPVLSVHVSYGFTMQGVVGNIQGRLLSADPAPAVRGWRADKPVLAEGVELTLTGERFREGRRVLVGGKPAKNVRVSSADELTCTLPDLPPGKIHALSVADPDGLVGDLAGGVPYGRVLQAVRPREALPDGGDVVTVTGAGFEKDTVFAFNGQPAEVVELSPTEARLRVPAGSAGRAKVTASTGKAVFAGDPLFGYAPHPYLYFRTADLPALREKFDKPMFRHYRRRILDHADGHLRRELGGDQNASVNATTNLAFAWALTQKPAYREKLMEWARRGWKSTDYTDFHMMSVAGMAIAYDVLFPELSPEERTAFLDYLDRMLDGYLTDAPGSWFMGAGPNFSNTVPVGNSGGMLAGLAVMHSTPRANDAIDLAAAKAKRYPDECISPEGGCREGVQYWDYGLSFYLILAHALKNATGDDRGLLDHPHLRNNVNFIRTQLGGHGGLSAFCDTREPFLDGYAIGADLGSRFHQPLMLWVADRAAEGGGQTRARDVWAPFAFLWRSEQPAPEDFPGVPTLAYLKDMHWGAMRSDGTFTPALVVGVKGSRGPLTHHKQHDLGSYVVQANGEPYLVDPGYYEPKPTDHTLPLVDGAGPGVTGSSITDAWEKGPWRHMTLDSTDGYGKGARRVRRLIVMHGTDRVVVLDDLVPAKGKPGQITAQYQTAWAPAIDADDPAGFTLQGQNGSLRVRCYGHPIALSAEDRKFTSGWCWKKISKDGPGDWQSVRGTYTADPARPLVTTLEPAPADKEPAPAPQVRYEKDAVTVEFADGVTMRFRQTREGWQFVRP
ncbi:MAG: IPT/TIG domain-containing protein [Candidatus Brocadiia bacterium]